MPRRHEMCSHIMHAKKALWYGCFIKLEFGDLVIW